MAFLKQQASSERENPVRAEPVEALRKPSTGSEGVNKSLMPALTAKNHPLRVENARRSTSYACAFRLERAAFDGHFGHAGFIHTFSARTGVCHDL